MLFYKQGEGPVKTAVPRLKSISSPVNLVIFATALKCRRQVHSRRHLRQKKKKKKNYGKKCRHAEYSQRHLKNGRWRRFSLIKIICSRLGFLFKFESEEKINSYAWLFKLIARN